VTQWVALSVGLAIHDEQIAEHGGLDGIRDFSFQEAALHRPQNLIAHEQADLADLAACYAYGLARNHAFADGNKRTSAVVTLLFLRLNDTRLEASEAECLEIWTALGAGQIDEPGLAAWMRRRLRQDDRQVNEPERHNP
jgi:death on curing protein